MTNTYLLIYFAASIPLLVAIGVVLEAILNRGGRHGSLHHTSLPPTIHH